LSTFAPLTSKSRSSAAIFSPLVANLFSLHLPEPGLVRLACQANQRFADRRLRFELRFRFVE
jgi:hypothetical protein